jgi:DeoR/GlpR family transcriptional regulator of sugar metabolism
MSYVLELLQTQPVVSVAGLARAFAVSEVTIRSDLASLARQGRVVRIRGGARTSHRPEVAFDLRLHVQEREKRAIARAAAAIVGDGEAIALDSSTTAYYIARELREKLELVVVTNGLRVATALAGAPGVSVIVLGGVLRTEAMSVVGDFVTRVLETTSINIGFFGACGIGLERGLTDLNPDEVRIKRELAAVCETVVGVVDHTKWQRTGLLSFVPPRRIDVIITDEQAPAEAVERWRKRAVEVVTADAREDDRAPRPPGRADRLPARRPRLGDRPPSP